MSRIIVFYLLFLSLNGFTQNVGIGTNTPSEKLDINGNLRINGALKPRGDAGVAGQVLRSNGNNNAPTWSNTGFTNMRSFEPGLADSIAQFTFTVPDGVYTMMVEMWGAGGPSISIGVDSFHLGFNSPLNILNHGGFMGGGGGAYAKKIFPVNPGEQLQVSVSRSNITLNGTSKLVTPNGTLEVENGKPGAFLFSNLFGGGNGGRLETATGIMAHPFVVMGENGTAIEAELMTENGTSKKILFTPGQGGHAAYTSQQQRTIRLPFNISTANAITPLFNNFNGPFNFLFDYPIGMGAQCGIEVFDGAFPQRGGNGCVILYW